MKRRWVYATVGFVALVFVGLIYAWSVFVKPLETEFGWLRSQTSLTFSISFAAFVVGGLTAGFAAKKFSPRLILLAGALFMLVGLTITSRVSLVWQMYVTYGVVSGFGVGLCYNSIMNAVLRWFPDMQGTLSGVLLMGFGFGGSLLGSLAVKFMTLFGWRSTFIIFGVGVATIIVLAAFAISLPSKEEIERLHASMKTATRLAAKDYEPKEMLKDSSFWFYYVWATLLTAAGLALIGTATPFALSMTATLGVAASVAGLISIFNGIGRFGFGLLLDWMGSRKTLILITGLFLAATAILLFAINARSLLLLSAGFVVAGLAYGGVTPANSAYAGQIYGQKNYALNFSLVNTAALVGAFLGPYISGILQSGSGGYTSTVVLIGGCAVVALPCTILMKRATNAKQQPDER